MFVSQGMWSIEPAEAVLRPLQALVAPLSGGAAAARAALLGARNALDPERYEESRQSR